MIMVLVKTDELCGPHVDTAFIATGDKEDLKRVVRQWYDAEIASYPLPWHDGNQGFVARERDLTLEAIDSHLDWSSGYHGSVDEYELLICEQELSYPYQCNTDNEGDAK